MDPSHDNRVEPEETEEFSSNESGWTKYIASPDPEHNFSSDVDDGDEADHDDMSCNMDNNDDDDDDHDSIASDASSGPAHHILPSEVGTVEGDHEDDEESSKFYTVARKKEAKERGGKARNNEANHRLKIQVKKNKQGDK